MHISCDELALARSPGKGQFCQKIGSRKENLLAQFVGTFPGLLGLRLTIPTIDATRVGHFPVRFGGNDDKFFHKI